MKEYNYFVSYRSLPSNTGMIHITTKKRINKYSDLESIRESIIKKVGNDVVILNWKELKR